MDDLLERLHQVELFSRVPVRDLRRLADLFEELRFDRPEYLMRQGEPSDRMFLLAGGEASEWDLGSDGLERLKRRFSPGASIGESTLFLDEPAASSVRAQGGSVVYALDRSRFEAYVQDHPSILDSLQVPTEVLARRDGRRFSWMTDDEVAVFVATKSLWALFGSLLMPVGLFLALMWIAAVITGTPQLLTAVRALAVVISGGWSGLCWLDWRNDHYVITNCRAVHHESRLLTLRVTVDQAFLRQIQHITILTPSPVARALGIGTLFIETAGRAHSIAFRHIDKPAACQQILSEWIERSRLVDQRTDRAAIREAIAQQLCPPSDDPGESERQPPRPGQLSGQVIWDLDQPTRVLEKAGESSPWWSALAHALDAILPHFRQQVGPVVTWYKHPFVLIKATFLPACVLAISFMAGIGWTLILGGDSFRTIALVLFFVWCMGLFWLLWRYEDWRNDIFQMTDEHIIDIDRLPLGLREQRRQASLEQVQNINVDIPNVWARVFNYGNVIIETAGRTGDLTFEWVMQPQAVQAEIFGRIEERRAIQRKEQEEQRRQEMANWVAVYHQMKEEGQI
jgi:membrane protein YdbS with pleckstrin-like domain